MSQREPDTDRGVTPVVGIVLLIAITLLLASTVAAFALAMGDQGQQPAVPTTALEFEYEAVSEDNDTLAIVHKSGETLEDSTIEVVLEDADCEDDGDANGRYAAADLGAPSVLSAGESITIDGSTTCDGGGDLDLSTATVRVVWIPDEESSTVLQSWTGPG